MNNKLKKKKALSCNVYYRDIIKWDTHPLLNFTNILCVMLMFVSNFFYLSYIAKCEYIIQIQYPFILAIYIYIYIAFPNKN